MAPRPVGRLVEIFGPIPVRRVWVEPVGEQEPWSRRSGVEDLGLDEVRLDRACRVAAGRRREPDVADEDPVARLGADDLEGRRLERLVGKGRSQGAGSLIGKVTRERAASRSWSRNHSPAKGRNQGCPSYGAGTSGKSSRASTGG